MRAWRCRIRRARWPGLPCFRSWRFELRQDGVRTIDLIEGKSDDGGVQGHRTIPRRIEPVVTRDRMDVAVEHQSDDLALRIDQRAAGIAPDDVVVGGHTERSLRIEPILDAHPAVRDSEGAHTVGALECAPEMRERLDEDAVLGPTPHGAPVEAQREG